MLTRLCSGFPVSVQKPCGNELMTETFNNKNKIIDIWSIQAAGYIAGLAPVTEHPEPLARYK